MIVERLLCRLTIDRKKCFNFPRININAKIQYHKIYIMSTSVSTGKHMICDLTNIRNSLHLESIGKMHELLEDICQQYDFTILTRSAYQFEPQGITVLYMLSESHISIHTFPEKRYLAFDIYTCRDYDDDTVYEAIYDKLVRWFQCDRGVPTIISRGTGSNSSECLQQYS